MSQELIDTPEVVFIRRITKHVHSVSWATLLHPL